jgi:hypothetical protein
VVCTQDVCAGSSLHGGQRGYKAPSHMLKEVAPVHINLHDGIAHLQERIYVCWQQARQQQQKKNKKVDEDDDNNDNDN